MLSSDKSEGISQSVDLGSSVLQFLELKGMFWTCNSKSLVGNRPRKVK